MKILYESRLETVGFCICPDCYKLEQRTHRYPFGQLTHCRECDSTEIPIEIDEMIAQTIILLNKKGYLTRACCSGHLDGHHGYIAFWKGCSPEFDNIPEFAYRLNQDYEEWGKPKEEYKSNVFRWAVDGDSCLGRLEDLLNKHKEIYKWAESLDKDNKS